MENEKAEIEPAFREYVVNVLKANGKTAESLKGYEDWELFACIALKVEKTIPRVKWLLRKHFKAYQKELEATMESLKQDK